MYNIWTHCIVFELCIMGMSRVGVAVSGIGCGYEQSGCGSMHGIGCVYEQSGCDSEWHWMWV